MGNVGLVAVVTLFLAPALQIGVIQLTMRFPIDALGQRSQGADQALGMVPFLAGGIAGALWVEAAIARGAPRAVRYIGAGLQLSVVVVLVFGFHGSPADVWPRWIATGMGLVAGWRLVSGGRRLFRTGSTSGS